MTVDGDRVGGVMFYRDAAVGLPVLVPVLSQNVDEGYRLVGPDGQLTAPVVHSQWEDNHPDGPDTHVTLSFDDGSTVVFPFNVPLTAVWHDEARPISEDDVRAAVPASWGVSGWWREPSELIDGDAASG